MKTATRLLCTALLASLGIGLAQAAPLTGANGSRLRIDVPEPPALALLGLGLVALGMGRRRTQRRN